MRGNPNPTSWRLMVIGSASVVDDISIHKLIIKVQGFMARNTRIKNFYWLVTWSQWAIDRNGPVLPLGNPWENPGNHSFGWEEYYNLSQKLIPS